MNSSFTPIETHDYRANRISRFVATQIARYRRSQTGNASIVFSLALIPLLACAGVAIDYLRADRTAVELQGFADAAALAAASAQNVTGTTAQKIAKRKAIALEYLESSLAAMEDVALKEPPVISVTNNTVDVGLKAVVSGSLVNVLSVSKDGADFSDAPDGGDYEGGGGKKINVGAHSKVAWSRDSYLCLLALNPHKTESIYFQGNSDFMAEVCAVQANSDAAIAMRTWGNAYAEAEDFCSVGGWAGSGFEPMPDSSCTVKSDPYASLVLPTVGACNYNNFEVKNTTQALTPGVYCGGISVRTHGIANLAPGLYIIKNGELEVDSQSTLYAGGGVTFYLTGNSKVDIMSGGTVTIEAPNSTTALASTQAYKSMAIMQDRNSGIGNENVIYSKGGVNITGAFYTPKQQLTVWANGDMNAASPYFPMIVDNMQMNGTATLHVRLDWVAAGFDEPPQLKTKGVVQITQ